MLNLNAKSLIRDLYCASSFRHINILNGLPSRITRLSLLTFVITSCKDFVWHLTVIPFASLSSSCSSAYFTFCSTVILSHTVLAASRTCLLPLFALTFSLCIFLKIKWLVRRESIFILIRSHMSNTVILTRNCSKHCHLSCSLSSF